MQARLLKLFMWVFPWIHATSEGMRFGYQLLYLLDSSPFYMPTLHLLGQTIVRISGQEMVIALSLATDDTQPALLSCPAVCKSYLTDILKQVVDAIGTCHVCILH